MRAASKRSPGVRKNRWWTAMTNRHGRRTGATSAKGRGVVTISVARSTLVLTLGLVAGCALKGDVRKVELQVQALRSDLAKSDTARAAERDTILAAVRLLQQALATQQAYLVQMRGDLRTELLSVQQQLVTVQELTGQSQQRLTELRSRIEARSQQPDQNTAPATSGGAPPLRPSGNPPGPSALDKLGPPAEQRRDQATARPFYSRVIAGYPRSPEADLARQNQQRLKPERPSRTAGPSHDATRRDAVSRPSRGAALAHSVEHPRHRRRHRRGLVRPRPRRRHRGAEAPHRPIPAGRSPDLHEPRRAVLVDAEGGVRAGLPARLADRDLPDLGVSLARVVRPRKAHDRSGARRRCGAIPGGCHGVLRVAAARRAQGAAGVPARRPERDDHDRPLLRHGGALRGRLRAYRRAAARRDDSGGAGHRDAAIPFAPAPLCGGDCGFPRRHPDAPGRRLDAADARAAPPAVRDQYLVRLGRESPARPECGDGDARPGPARERCHVTPRAESAASPTAGTRAAATRS